MAKLVFATSIKTVGFYSREEPAGSGTYVLELNVVRTDENVVNVQFIPGRDVIISNR